MKLEVSLQEARNLRPLDRPLQVYAQLKLGNTRYSSSVSATGSSIPYWYQKFTFNVDDPDPELEIILWNKDNFTDTFLGCFRHRVSQSVSSTWYPLHERNKRATRVSVTGDIRLAFSVSAIPDHSLRHNSSNVSTTSSAEDASLRTRSLDSFPSADIANSQDDTADSCHSATSVDGVPTDLESAVSSFFEDDGKYLPSSREDIPPPLEGGILVDGRYDVSAKSLNRILFGPGSQFLRHLAELQKTSDLVEGQWKHAEGNLLKREVTYVKAATKMLKAVKATEDQVYTRADNKGFVVNVSASTPDAPYGKTFLVQIQYSIFAGPDLSTGEKTSFLQVSWCIRFLINTMVKNFIESGARQGLQDSFKQFEQVLEKHARLVQQDSQVVESSQRDESMKVPKTDWQLAKETFWNLRICLTILGIVIILVHICVSTLPSNGGIEFWKIDLPDTFCELIISAILGTQIEHLFQVARNFSKGRHCRGSDHGVKARGNGWLLRVTLVEAENIQKCNGDSGLPDPFVVIKCLDQSRSSSVKLQKSNPKWEETFEFDATEAAPSIMNVEVFSFEGPFAVSKSIGHTEINFLKNTPDKLINYWAPLQSKFSPATGARIHLRIVLMNTKEETGEVDYIQKVEKHVGRKINRQSFMKNVSFQKLFALPSEEFLVNDFSCSLKKTILLQGRLFLSPRVLAFYSNIFGHKTRFTLLWEDIEEIKDATPNFGSVSALLNPAILVITKKGRARDAQHAAKSVDDRGRLKFQFQSFIRYKPALKTMTTLWKYRTLSPEERMELIADFDNKDDGSVSSNEQSEETDMFVGGEEVNLTEVHTMELPLSVNSMIQIYEKENLDEKIAGKVGWLAYCPTPWETVNAGVQHRRISFKLSNKISLFGTNVTIIQQKATKAGGNGFTIEEEWTLHDVPFGDNFQIRVRKELERVTASITEKALCKVWLGISWQKSTIFQNHISKNIYDRFSKHLKDIVDTSVMEILEHRNETAAQ